MITELINQNGNFIIAFDNIYGSGWDDDLIKIVIEKINPPSIVKNVIETGWYYSEKEFNIEKDNVQFILHLDDESSAYLRLLSSMTESNKQKLRGWATIIASEVEKLKGS